MGIFSKTCEYAMRAVFFIAHRTADGGRVDIKEIASGINSPEYFLAKNLQELSRKGIVKSVKGPRGGFHMDDVALKRRLSDVVEAIDGMGFLRTVVLGLIIALKIIPVPCITNSM